MAQAWPQFLMRPQRQMGCSFFPTIARFPLPKGAKRKAREMMLLIKFQSRKHCSRTQLWQKRGLTSWWDRSVRQGARFFLCTIARFQSTKKQKWAMPKICTWFCRAIYDFTWSSHIEKLNACYSDQVRTKIWNVRPFMFAKWAFRTILLCCLPTKGAVHVLLDIQNDNTHRHQ